jgi:asparagine synthase (glutamine-hydrolysing)
MRDEMAHRGPDYAGIWISDDRYACLGHRRLAIIDRSSNGNQPMSDCAGSICITFNGEIYNFQELRAELEGKGHVFKSNTDTEVILKSYQEWDLDCLDRLDGMFAFGIYDANSRRLVLARDRAGEKPLFFRLSNGTVTFASELKSLLIDPSCPRSLDLEALKYYLAFGYVPGSMCLVEGVSKLPPGKAVVFDVDMGTQATWRYWALPDSDGATHESVDELVCELEGFLESSVRQRLIADVPVGVMLSGGLDSSIVTALAARIAKGVVRTFTVIFPGNSRFDEASHARLVADYFGTVHTELEVETQSVDLLPRLAWQFDEPIGDSSMIPTYLISEAIRKHATVALGGDGGDELFGGYSHYSRLQRVEQVRPWIPRPIRAGVGRMAGRYLPVGLKGRNYAMALSRDIDFAIASVNVVFDRNARERVLTPEVNHQGNPFAPEAYKMALCRGESVLRQATTLDFSTYLPEDILVKIDRASMLNSLEVRAPWLSRPIIEFAFGRLPDRLRATTRDRKVICKRLGARLLPKSFDFDRKQGFSIPLSAWLRGNWGREIAGILSGASPELFNEGEIATLLKQRRGVNNANRLFTLAMLELWRVEYRI